jgi:hypothetical protein
MSKTFDKVFVKETNPLDEEWLKEFRNSDSIQEKVEDIIELMESSPTISIVETPIGYWVITTTTKFL